MPLLLTVSNYWYMLRRREAIGQGSESISQSTSIHGGASYVWPAAFLTIANTFQSWAMSNARSTYICPLSSNACMTIPLLQILGSLLDCFILISIESLVLTPAGDASSDMVFDPAFLGSILMLFSLISSIGGIIAVITNTVYWIELFDPGWSYASTVAWYSVLFTIAVIAALHIWAHQGLLHLALFILWICSYSNGLTLSWMDRDVLPYCSNPSGCVPRLFPLGYHIIYTGLCQLRSRAIAASGLTCALICVCSVSSANLGTWLVSDFSNHKGTR